MISRFNFIIDFLKHNDLELSDLTNSHHFEKLKDLLLKNYGYFHRFDPQMKDFQRLLKVITKLNLKDVAESCYDPIKPEPVKMVIDETLSKILQCAKFSSQGFIPKPKSTSSKKRMTLFLRWIVRSEYPDLGIWKFISPAHLYISLDLGILRVFSRITGITLRNNWNGVMRITNYFKNINPLDPSKYDYVLSRPAILDICKKNLEESDCDACFLNEICLTGKEKNRRCRNSC